MARSLVRMVLSNDYNGLHSSIRNLDLEKDSWGFPDGMCTNLKFDNGLKDASKTKFLNVMQKYNLLVRPQINLEDIRGPGTALTSDITTL